LGRGCLAVAKGHQHLPNVDHLPDRDTYLVDNAAVWGRHLDDRFIRLQHQDDLVFLHLIANGNSDVLNFCFMDTFT
jgi:hypothetical protein